jgi:hypothetical protein
MRRFPARSRRCLVQLGFSIADVGIDCGANDRPNSDHRNGLHIRTAFVDGLVCFVAQSRARYLDNPKSLWCDRP